MREPISKLPSRNGRAKWLIAWVVMVGVATAGAVAPAVAHFPSASDLRAEAEQEQAATTANARQRRSVIGAHMRLEPREEKLFWPVYEQYEARMDQVDYRYASEIAGYERFGGKLAGDEAAHKLDELMSTLQARLEIQKWYIIRFRSLLPPSTVTRFFEIDDRVRTASRCDLVSIKSPATSGLPQVRSK
jgi:hypothetical protein